MELLPEQVVARIFDFIEKLEHAQNNLDAALHREVELYGERIRAEAVAWRGVKGSNREQREAFVKEDCLTQILAHEHAQADSKVALKTVDGCRQSLSALQSAAKGVVEESQHARYGPDYDASQAAEDDAGLRQRMEAQR